MFSYSSHESVAINFYSENQTYYDGANLSQTAVDYSKYGHTYAEEFVGSTRNGALNDSLVVSGRSQWASTHLDSTQSASFTTQSYYTDADAATDLGDSSPVVGTYPKQAAASASVSSHKYTLTSTQSTVFSTVFATVGTSSITGSASATTQGTSTYTATAAQAGTVYLFGDGAMAQIYNADRGWLPPTRLVGKAFAITSPSISNGPHPAASISGDFSWVSNFYNKQTASTVTNTIVASPPNFTYTKNYTSSYEYFDVTEWTSTQLQPAVSAKRKIYASQGYIFPGASSGVFTSYNLSPAGLSALSLFVSAFPGIYFPRIFTTVFGGFNLDGSSGLARWVYTNSEWSLQLTKTNSSTSITLWGTISLSGSNSTVTDNATTSVGNTTAILGPGIPITRDSAHLISVSVFRSGTASTGPIYYFSAPGGSSFAEASSSRSDSTAFTLTAGSQTESWAPATFENSILGAYKKNFGASFSTASTTKNDLGLAFTLPSVWMHSKYNEAGRADPVSVIQ
jgi:hypothetical protein